ncbi:acyltransferase family protein [Legionella worsleiensis]|uniref:Putative Heparan-alpha-glucosaminide N-acetyltransferase n=1 Tax=Legionella worsleiensis TaxID=45076 RepID=A0A0W1A7F0_9GAMM|nr:heparan-alpha-glucosaminide N-acetyltransferase domain-containing protein [Legionella worsleiensis]KTD76979.1 putative Heparan-alpha-glucosaminide N-acetyltransferase [Legionella worsleiensis]STY33349.1 Putative heparan-alpha-glucosaminide N-acetyltransferase [Legionella worsleiensis]
MADNLIVTHRIASLDVFRGLTIVLMILVNSQGNQFAYPILEHAPWNGCTLADLVFPFFLFIVGLTCAVSLNSFRRGGDGSVYWAIFRRSVLLFALGVFLNIFPTHIHLSSLRVYGILQRIAVCYFISAVLYLKTNVKVLALIFLLILLSYWFVMTQIPVPGYGANQLTPEGSWVSFCDQLIFSSAHLLEKVYDPEGFLSTLPSVATTLAGVLTGNLLLGSQTKPQKMYRMMFFGVLFLMLGWLWSYSFPINKNLWTSSFVLWSSGCALIAFSLCFLLVDILHYRRCFLPLTIFGTNALFAFTFHVLLLKLQFVFYFKLNSGAKGNMKTMLTEYWFGYFSPPNAALLYSLFFLLLNFVIVTVLYKKRIFIRL